MARLLQEVQAFQTSTIKRIWMKAFLSRKILPLHILVCCFVWYWWLVSRRLFCGSLTFVFPGSNATSSKGNNFLISGVLKPSVMDVLDHLQVRHHWGMQLCQIIAKYNYAKLMQCAIIHSFLIKETLSKTPL